MNKQLCVFKEKTGLYDYLMIALLSTLSAVVLIRSSVKLVNAEPGTGEWGIFLALELVLISGMVFLYRSWRQVKIGPKGVNLKWRFLGTNKRKVRAEEIVAWEVVRESPLAMWSGWNVHPHLPNHSILFFRGRGVLLHLRDGSSVLVGVKNLDEALNALEANIGQSA